MTHATLTPAEIEMLGGLGVDPTVVFTPRAFTEAEVEALAPNEVVELPQPKRYSDEVEGIAAKLLKDANGDHAAAKLALLDWINVEHAKVKLSKNEATTLGVDSSKHNIAEWKRLKGIQDQIGAALRRQVAPGYIRTKIRNNKGA